MSNERAIFQLEKLLHTKLFCFRYYFPILYANSSGVA